MFQHTKEEIVVNVPFRTGRYHLHAEAIREGCKLAPVQCFNKAYADERGASLSIFPDEGSRQHVPQACVVGALYLIGWPNDERCNESCPRLRRVSNEHNYPFEQRP